MMANAWRSASNLAITCFVSIPSLMIFNATFRCRTLLLDHEDRAKPPLRLSSYGRSFVIADARAGGFGDGGG